MKWTPPPMIRKLMQSIHEAETRWSRSFGDSLETPRDRFKTWVHFYLSDHAFLRRWWTNMDEIAPGVWRSNQPSPARMRKLHAQGIRTILNLRGEDKYSYYLLEKREADRLGMKMYNIRAYARELMPAQTYLDLLDVFEVIERPFVLHCKSGADRAGLASALWLLHMEGRPIEEAQEMLSFRYIHLKNARTGILDDLLACYAEDNAAQPISIRDWFATRYDPERVEAAFAKRRGKT